MLELLSHFENIIVIRTLLDNMNLNYIPEEDMQDVLDIANECGIDFGNHTLNDSDLIKVYQDWLEIINNEYLITRDKFV